MNEQEKGNRHEITTIDELVRLVTLENVVALSEDLTSWLVFIASSKKTGLIKSMIRTNVFQWIDDGERNINVKIKQLPHD